MGSKTDMTRKEFLTLTFTLVGTAAAVGACSDDNNGNDGGFGGTFGNTGGTTGHGGTGGTSAHGGTGGTGTGGTAGTSAGGTGGGNATACADPLPESQVTDTTGHTHTVTIAASTLNATSAQTFATSVAEPGTASAHMHMITLEPAQLSTLKGGGNVTVMSTIVMSHGHMFMISCH
jgi:hypothetical protein